MRNLLAKVGNKSILNAYGCGTVNIPQAHVIMEILLKYFLFEMKLTVKIFLSSRRSNASEVNSLSTASDVAHILGRNHEITPCSTL